MGRPGAWICAPPLPTPLPPLPPPPCRGDPGRGGSPLLLSLPLSLPQEGPLPLSSSFSLGLPAQRCRAQGLLSLATVLPQPQPLPQQPQPSMTPVSLLPPLWGFPLCPSPASGTPPPPRRCPQDSPGLRIGPLIPEQDYERLEDGDLGGSQDSPLHGESSSPCFTCQKGSEGSGWVGVGLGRPWSL